MNVESVIKWLIGLIIVVSLVFAGFYLINYGLKEYEAYKRAIIMREKGNVIKGVADTAQGFMRLGFSDINSADRTVANVNQHVAAQEATICKLIDLNKGTINNYKHAIVSYLETGLNARCSQVKYAKKRIIRSAAEISTLEKKLHQLRMNEIGQSK